MLLLSPLPHQPWPRSSCSLWRLKPPATALMAVASRERVMNVKCLSATKSLWISVSCPCLLGSILLQRQSLSLWKGWPATNLLCYARSSTRPSCPHGEDALSVPDRALSSSRVILSLPTSQRRFWKGRLFSISKLPGILYRRTSLTCLHTEILTLPAFLALILPAFFIRFWSPMSLYTLFGTTVEHVFGS